AASLGEQVAEIRRVSLLPIAVGFGISTSEQAKTVARHADAVVVGSAIVDLIAKQGRESVPSVTNFVRGIVSAIR
ncbi:MAG TPA: geranylgeranylglyceryl/heptaprenylglyceryl phosphate synthase, partial [Chthoniobacterales bacterium]|nr:geranylgeranylglyceryl/heptaprenylglyceryl phosphate synthase [Chthoniobacterales bacterium]